MCVCVLCESERRGGVKVGGGASSPFCVLASIECGEA